MKDTEVPKRLTRMIMERTRDVKKRIANLPFPKRRRAQSKLKALKKQLVKRKQ